MTDMKQTGKVVYVNGPIVRVDGASALHMYELVQVGELHLTGEVIGLSGDEAVVQVYEETSGLRPGAPAYASGTPLAAELGPGLIESMFDGILRPLRGLEKASGAFIGRGVTVPALDRSRLWPVVMKVKAGDPITPGMIVAEVQETSLFTHRVLAPPDVEGRAIDASPDGAYNVDQVLVRVAGKGARVQTIALHQRWPVRRARPNRKRLAPSTPLITGQRVIDALFPIAKGGSAAIPGGFGTGKTMTQHQLAKWAEADLVVYIGCGERGNEMTEVLEDFPKLIDPRTGRPLMERTVLIANTSNMPVAAREASIYTGITVAEYFRDMGCDVALMADSTSRWAEALRELSGRLEEIPAEEGFPAYLGTKLGEFYERAGAVEALCGKPGSVTVIGAVSPPGGDFSEPVTQHTRRFIRCFWGLDRGLAGARHYPAIHWLESYSDYGDELRAWFAANVAPDWHDLVERARTVLQQEDELQQIVKLVGEEVLADDQKLILRTSHLIKVGFLQQAAFDPVDTYCPPAKQEKLLRLYLRFQERAAEVIARGAHISNVEKLAVFERLPRLKASIPNDKLEQLDAVRAELESQMDALMQQFSGEEKRAGAPAAQG
jgi:V/A-type H+-transporting ATPase subunit A